MSYDSQRDLIVTELLSLRRKPGPFETRLAESTMLISLVGGGNLRYARDHLERIRRAHAGNPESDVATFFASAGYRTEGDTLEARWKTLAQRHFVSERTVLRRSDRGAVAIAQLIRHEQRYERPTVYLIAVQDGSFLRVHISFLLEPDEVHDAPIVFVGGQRQALEAERSLVESGHRRLTYRLDPVPLDLDVEADAPILDLFVAWISTAAPIWNLGTHLTDPRLYSRHVFDAIMPNLTLRIYNS